MKKITIFVLTAIVCFQSLALASQGMKTELDREEVIRMFEEAKDIATENEKAILNRAIVRLESISDQKLNIAITAILQNQEVAGNKYDSYRHPLIWISMAVPIILALALL